MAVERAGIRSEAAARRASAGRRRRSTTRSPSARCGRSASAIVAHGSRSRRATTCSTSPAAAATRRSAAAQAGRARGRASTLTPELFDDRPATRPRTPGVEIERVGGRRRGAACRPTRASMSWSRCSSCMFAPRHRVAAAELARVLRPGGAPLRGGVDAARERWESCSPRCGGYMPAPPADRRAAGAVGLGGPRARACSRTPACELEFTPRDGPVRRASTPSRRRSSSRPPSSGR